MADKIEVDGSSSSSNDWNETIKRLLDAPILNKKTGYQNFDARKAFIQLSQAFTWMPILEHFDQKWYIQIETDTSSYVISRY